MQTQTKAVLAVIALSSLMLLLPLTATHIDAAKKTDTKVKKCNNVKIQVNVENANSTDSIKAVATLNGFVTSKTVDVNETESTVTIPLNFKKISPCPETGNIFLVDVNGVTYNGEITSTKKPNKITVTLP